jgi:hypothetical protein
MTGHSTTYSIQFTRRRQRPRGESLTRFRQSRNLVEQKNWTHRLITGLAEDEDD